jgi:hypothetical protein
MSIQKPQRMVLLALRLEHIDPRLLTSSLNLCKRLNAGMEILTIVPGANLPVAARDLLDALDSEQVFHVLTEKPALRRRDIVAYANSHENIAAVVIDSFEGWETIAQDKNSDPWKKLECPLITAATTK